MTDFYKGQMVRFVDKEHKGHWYIEYNKDENGQIISKVGYGSREQKFQSDLNYGEVYEVVNKQCTPTGICVKNQNGEQFISLWHWFVDDNEWKNNNRTEKIDKMISKK